MIDVDIIAEPCSHSDIVCERNIDNPGLIPDMVMTRSQCPELETANNEVPASSATPDGGVATTRDDEVPARSGV